MSKYPNYSPAETAFLRAHYATATKAELLAGLPGRPWEAILNKANRLKIPGRPPLIPVGNVGIWSPANLEVLRTHYPVSGAPKVVELVGCTTHAARAAAARFGVAYVAQGPVRDRNRPARAPKAAPAPKPRPPRAQGPLLAVKRSAGTPQLNLQKEARKQKQEAPKRAALITADEVRRLPYNHPGRRAYTLNGTAGWQQWHQQQQTNS